MRPHTLTLAILVAGLVSLCGCRRSSSEAKKPPPTVTTITGESTLLPRAPAAKDAAATVAPKQLTAAGMKRDYLLVAPKAPAPGPLPLVLVVHGDGGHMIDFHNEWPFEQATQNDAYVVYLEGRHATWDLETRTDNVDIAYAEAVVEDVGKALPIDKTRVFATGYSSGGFFVNVLACHRPGLLRGIASNAGGAPFNQAETWPNGYPKCPGQQPVAALALHGDKDGTVTLDSGRFDAEYWAYINGCNEAELETTGYPDCHAYKGCKAGKSVAFCAIPGLNHWVWSESAAASWKFFQLQ